MPEWRDSGIVLSIRKYGEKGMIANILTLKHGRHLGWISNYKKKVVPAQPGDLVDIFWKSRLIDQMGYFKVELISSVTGKILHDKIKLQAVISLCTLLEKVLPERHCYSEIFNATQAFINLLLIDDDILKNAWFEGYVKWEIGILSSIGFSLKLDQCAVTGQENSLYYVSPKTGKAVSKEGAGEFASKLFLLPRFLGGAEIVGSDFNQEIIAGLKITSYFFENKLLLSINNNSYLPNTRNRLIEMIGNL